MTLEDTLKLALEAIEELKGEAVRVLDVTELTSITDYMVICNGRSARHAKRLGEHLMRQAKAAGLRPRVEGLAEAEWILIDLSGVVVHIMQSTARAYYQLEKLWDISARPAERHAEP
jgi:ribosome-associated protein